MAIWVINAFHNLKCMVNAYPYFFLLVDYTISPIVYKHLWQSLFLWLTLVLAKLYAFHALDSIYPPPPPRTPFSYSYYAFQNTFSEINQVGKDWAQVSDFTAAFNTFLYDTFILASCIS